MYSSSELVEMDSIQVVLVEVRRLPFSFAWRQGVVLLTADGVHGLAYRPGVELVALAEAQHFVGAQLPLHALSLEAPGQDLPA